MKALRAVADAVWPRTCMTCEARVEEEGLCPACWRDMPFLRAARCDGCGLPLPGPGDEPDGGPIRCDGCLAEPRPWAAGRAALAYAGPARALVLRLKHGDRPDLAVGAGLWMHRAARGAVDADTLVVPVPLHPWRLWRRRYNQAALLARELARHADAAFAPQALRRVRRTPTLDRRPRAERMALLDRAIAADPAQVAGQAVALVDDVMTTGATLAACTEALAGAGAARVTVHVLARVERDAGIVISEAMEESPDEDRDDLHPAPLRVLHRSDPPPPPEGRDDRRA
ncbi:ComF family protein [Jannaschia sp. Os4]|uniref:ComF family protein n=1 Tax=Jannaschia sp. Os4 TaxID=2807617 RepID=UPI0031B5C90E